MSRVLLVNMPFSSLRWPALGISLLQAELKREGIDCDLAYFNFDLAEIIGLEAYEWVNDSLGFVLGGERLFAQTLFGSSLSSDLEYDTEVLLATDPEFSREDKQVFENVGKQLEAFLDGCLMKIDWSRYALVGFTTTFQQTMASLALASRIKQHDPRITICLGGANCEGVMGRTRWCLPESGSCFRPFLPDQPRVALMILWITGGVTFLILCLSRFMGVHLAVTQYGTRCL